MTDEEFRDVVELRDSMNLVYNVNVEEWMTKGSATRDPQPIEWFDVLVAAPHLSLNDLDAIQEWLRRQAK